MRNLPEVTIALDSWIIQDGNYGDFVVGQVQKFALEFWTNDLTPSARKDFSMTYLGGCNYRVCGQIIFADANVWAIDFGIRGFRESEPPSFARPGVWVEGVVGFGIDPFFYAEYLHRVPGLSNLEREWKIQRISRNETPWIETRNDRGGIVCTRDDLRERWVDAAQTDAWNDDGGSASYLLHCTCT